MSKCAHKPMFVVRSFEPLHLLQVTVWTVDAGKREANTISPNNTNPIRSGHLYDATKWSWLLAEQCNLVRALKKLWDCEGNVPDWHSALLKCDCLQKKFWKKRSRMAFERTIELSVPFYQKIQWLDLSAQLLCDRQVRNIIANCTALGKRKSHN